MFNEKLKERVEQLEKTNNKLLSIVQSLDAQLSSFLKGSNSFNINHGGYDIETLHCYYKNPSQVPNEYVMNKIASDIAKAIMPYVTFDICNHEGDSEFTDIKGSVSIVKPHTKSHEDR